MKPLQYNFGADGNYLKIYLKLFAGTGQTFQDEGYDTTRHNCAEGYNLFAFDITPDCCDGPHFNLVHKGNLRVEMHLENDRNRNVVYDC